MDDYSENLPALWEKHGGVFLPMYQSEAMWIRFESDYPCAVKIAVGKIDAVTGDPWTDLLVNEPQNYLVVPDQPWLDGFYISKGKIRQFVAMPLGEGYTAEEQVTGEVEHGGIQIMVYPMKKSRFEELRQQVVVDSSAMLQEMDLLAESPDMGLAPGGLMRQEIYEDEYGFEAWETGVHSRCFVHIANSAAYQSITGSPPPTEPPAAAQYTEAGLPWFEYYAAELKAVEGSEKLAGLDSVAAKGIKKGEKPLPENQPVQPKTIKKIYSKRARVREGEF
ncbi:MAG: hypothetical protein VCE91_01320 [Nitrospinota bacterium]